MAGVMVGFQNLLGSLLINSEEVQSGLQIVGNLSVPFP